MNMILDALAAIGRTLRESIASIGFATRFFFNLVRMSVKALNRPGLISEQTHFIGNHSLVIIIVSGLFVGMVLGLQGYITLTPYGAEQKLGQVVALALVRELGPVVTALLFAGRAGTSLRPRSPSPRTATSTCSSAPPSSAAERRPCTRSSRPAHSG